MHYSITEKISGGHSVIYKAEDTGTHRVVALKFLPPGAVHSRAILRFQQDAQAAAALNHPNICTVYEIGEQDGQTFIAMELLQGTTLAHRLESGPLPPELFANLGIEISNALAAAHAKNIVHGGLSPSSIFITSDGHAKILDFGLARASVNPEKGPGQRNIDAVPVALTPYMSPEQASGKSADALSDIFSLGTLLYEMATATRAFQAESPQGLSIAILKSTPTPASRLNPAYPADIDRLISRALQKDPEARYQQAARIHADLKFLKHDLASAIRYADPVVEPRISIPTKPPASPPPAPTAQTPPPPPAPPKTFTPPPPPAPPIRQPESKIPPAPPWERPRVSPSVAPPVPQAPSAPKTPAAAPEAPAPGVDALSSTLTNPAQPSSDSTSTTMASVLLAEPPIEVLPELPAAQTQEISVLEPTLKTPAAPVIAPSEPELQQSTLVEASAEPAIEESSPAAIGSAAPVESPLVERPVEAPQAEAAKIDASALVEPEAAETQRKDSATTLTGPAVTVALETAVPAVVESPAEPIAEEPPLPAPEPIAEIPTEVSPAPPPEIAELPAVVETPAHPEIHEPDIALPAASVEPAQLEPAVIESVAPVETAPVTSASIEAPPESPQEIPPAAPPPPAIEEISATPVETSTIEPPPQIEAPAQIETLAPVKTLPAIEIPAASEIVESKPEIEALPAPSEQAEPVEEVLTVLSSAQPSAEVAPLPEILPPPEPPREETPALPVTRAPEPDSRPAKLDQKLVSRSEPKSESKVESKAAPKVQPKPEPKLKGRRRRRHLEKLEKLHGASTPTPAKPQKEPPAPPAPPRVEEAKSKSKRTTTPATPLVTTTPPAPPASSRKKVPFVVMPKAPATPARPVAPAIPPPPPAPSTEKFIEELAAKVTEQLTKQINEQISEQNNGQINDQNAEQLNNAGPATATTETPEPPATAPSLDFLRDHLDSLKPATESQPLESAPAETSLNEATTAALRAAVSAATAKTAAPPANNLLYGIAAVLCVVALAAVWGWRQFSTRAHLVAEPLSQHQITHNPPENRLFFAGISPNGRYLAYCDTLGLHLSTIETGAVRDIPLPDDLRAHIWDVVWFPDGENLLLVSESAPTSPAPSSKATAAAPDEGDVIWATSIFGGNPRKLRTQANWPAVSPDGATIAFISAAPNSPASNANNATTTASANTTNNAVWVMGANGENPRVVASSQKEFYTTVGWSPTGDRIAYEKSPGFTSGGVIETIPFNANASAAENAPTPGTKPPSLPLPTNVLTNSKLWSGEIPGFIWLHDGRMLFLTRRPAPAANISDDTNDNTANDVSDFETYSVAVDPQIGTRIGNAVKTSIAGFTVGATADAKQLVSIRLHSREDVWVAELSTSGPKEKLDNVRRFTVSDPNRDSNDYPTGWATDSKSILFASDRLGLSQIFSQPLNENSNQPASSAAAPASAPLFRSPDSQRHALMTPDGAWILYWAFPPATGANLPVKRIMRLPASATGATTEPQQVLESPLDEPVDFLCPRGTSGFCVLRRWDGNQLFFYTLDPARGQGQQLGHIRLTLPQDDLDWDVSRDVTRVALSSPSMFPGQIRLLDLRTGNDSSLPLPKDWRVAELNWSASGDSLFLNGESPDSYFEARLDLSGKSQTLLERPKSQYLGPLIPAPDGRHVAFYQHFFEANAFLIQNF